MKAFSVSRERGAPCSLGNGIAPKAPATAAEDAQLLLNRWRDAETGDSLSATDIEHMAMKVLGLPHQTLELARQYKMVPPDPLPECSEPVDVLIEHGQALGSAGEGRAPLVQTSTEVPAVFQDNVRPEGGRTCSLFSTGTLSAQLHSCASV